MTERAIGLNSSDASSIDEAEYQIKKDSYLNSLIKKGRLYALGALAAAALLPAMACSGAKEEEMPPKVVIMDPLSITNPFSKNMDNAAQTLKDHGYGIAYIPPNPPYNVEHDIFRDLPQSDAEIIIIRAHSSDVTFSGNVVVNNEIGLFMSQEYIPSLYVEEQRANEIFPARFNDGRPGVYFSFGSKFVEDVMRGKFDDGTKIIVMGCNSLGNTTLADAFFEKGIDTYFGWKGSVTAEHTDKATEALINHLIVDGMDSKQAVEATNQEIGPDPYFGGRLEVIENEKDN